MGHPLPVSPCLCGGCLARFVGDMETSFEPTVQHVGTFPRREMKFGLIRIVARLRYGLYWITVTEKSLN